MENGLIYNDIEQSINHPKKLTCCATYVSSVLYLAGYFKAEEMTNANGFNYNYQVSISDKFKSLGWKKITEQSQLQPGDIVFMEYNSGNAHFPDHVQIYAGNDKWYNAGADMYIQSPAPYSTSSNWTSGLTWWAYRPPVLK